VATWDDVRELALALPEAEESTSFRKPAFKVGGKAFAWESPHEHGALVLRCDALELPFILESDPSAFYVTPHYDGYPMVLVRMDAIDREELAGRLEDSWAIAAPPRLLPAG
jgi:hypothetical protein